MVIRTVTCDKSCNFKELRNLEMEGLIQVFAVAIEGNEDNRRATNKVLPTIIIGNRFALIGDDDNPRCVIAANDCRYESILDLLGKKNREDALHLEAHIRDGRDAFVTEDKDDILSKHKILQEKFGVTVLHTSQVRSWIEDSSQ